MSDKSALVFGSTGAGPTGWYVGIAEQHRARADCASTPRKQLGCRRCSWSGSSPGPQEDVARLQDAEAGNLSPTRVTAGWQVRQSLSNDHPPEYRSPVIPVT